jgi:hypothetical protein
MVEKSPFLSVDADVRCVVRCVASIIRRFRTASLLCQGDEYLIKDTEAAPPDEAIIQSLVRTIRFRSVFLLKAVADHTNDPAQNTPVIHA